MILIRILFLIEDLSDVFFDHNRAHRRRPLFLRLKELALNLLFESEVLFVIFTLFHIDYMIWIFLQITLTLCFSLFCSSLLFIHIKILVLRRF